MPIVAPFNEMCRLNNSTILSACLSFSLSTCSRISGSYPVCLDLAIRALRSLGRQEPPKPMPEFRNLLPIRSSYPGPFATSYVSILSSLQMFQISFIKDTLAA